MAISWEWKKGDSNEGVFIDHARRAVQLWGSVKRDIPFDQFLKDGGTAVPENIRAEVLASVRGLEYGDQRPPASPTRKRP